MRGGLCCILAQRTELPALTCTNVMFANGQTNDVRPYPAAVAVLEGTRRANPG